MVAVVSEADIGEGLTRKNMKNSAAAETEKRVKTATLIRERR